MHILEYFDVIMPDTDIKPTNLAEIEYKGFKFLITHRPSDLTIPLYIQELKKHNVFAVVRVCEPTYKTNELIANNIGVFDLVFEDGTSPSKEIIQEWFKILREKFTEKPECCIAVHCIAGLGRAPVMVAMALIELGLKYEEAVELIRNKRRGAINAKQLAFLEKYKPKGRLSNSSSSCCTQ